jgi:hypothetical protein
VSGGFAFAVLARSIVDFLEPSLCHAQNSTCPFFWFVSEQVISTYFYSHIRNCDRHGTITEQRANNSLHLFGYKFIFWF